MAAGDWHVINSPQDGTKWTYTQISAVATQTGAGDVIELTGSATKTIRLLRCVVTVAGTGANTPFVTLLGLVRSTVATGGTRTTGAIRPNDANAPPATATVNRFTADPTSGLLIGGVRAEGFLIEQQNALGSRVAWLFGDSCGQGLVLRGASNTFCINCNGSIAASSTLLSYLEWTEE